MNSRKKEEEIGLLPKVGSVLFLLLLIYMIYYSLNSYSKREQVLYDGQNFTVGKILKVVNRNKNRDYLLMNVLLNDSVKYNVRIRNKYSNSSYKVNSFYKMKYGYYEDEIIYKIEPEDVFIYVDSIVTFSLRKNIDLSNFIDLNLIKP